MNKNNAIHEKYLPFEEGQLRNHFIEKSDKNIQDHIDTYLKQVRKYEKWEINKSNIKRSDYSRLRQIEKDETVWTISSLLSLYYSKNKNQAFIDLLSAVFGEKPPTQEFNTWEACFKGDWKLYFEPQLPSPKEYTDYLQKWVQDRVLIPYVLEKAKASKPINDLLYRSKLEGATNVDALIINPINGFSVIIEAKVLSDISKDIYYDDERNQLARNIDIMLTDHSNREELMDISKRKLENTLFLLLTPEKFKSGSKSRLYRYKYEDYTSDIKNLKADLPHRNFTDLEWKNIQKRIGWITWEDIKSIEPEACKWLDKSVIL